MSADTQQSDWKFYRLGFFVTGDGEAAFLPKFLSVLTESGNCTVRVVRKIEQVSAQQEKRKLKMVGKGKIIPDKDQDRIGLPIREFLSTNQNSFAIVVDDLENGRTVQHQAIFDRYRLAIDTMLKKKPELQSRASVHFFINMIEAYFFADIDSAQQALGNTIVRDTGDVESIRHPKNNLKQQLGSYDEIEDGERVAKQIRLDVVLNNPETCRSLRTLIKWCMVATRQQLTERFRLTQGRCHPVTESQVALLQSNSGPAGLVGQ